MGSAHKFPPQFTLPVVRSISGSDAGHETYIQAGHCSMFDGDAARRDRNRINLNFNAN